MRGFGLMPTLAKVVDGCGVMVQPVMEKAPPRST